MKPQIFILSIFTVFAFTAFSQNYKAFNDTNVAVIKGIVVGQDYISYNHDLKDDLKDGYWKFYSTNDSTKKDIENYLEVEGRFKDGLREGLFQYYNLVGLKKSKKRVNSILINYSNGVFDGEIVFKYNGEYFIYQGNYKDGLRDGCFVWYFPKSLNIVKRIEWYREGKLLQWIEYKKDGTIRKQGIGEEE